MAFGRLDTQRRYWLFSCLELFLVAVLMTFLEPFKGRGTITVCVNHLGL